MSSPAPVEPATQIAFRCTSCRTTFDAQPERTVPAPDRAHPYSYYSPCPDCQQECPQAPWQIGLFNAHLKATGPKTAAGKVASSANLAGHPTPAETRITRFNAMKHGAAAKTAMYFPARPGRYPHCKTCDIDHDYCRQQAACLKRSDLLLRCLVAIESGDPAALQDIHAINQANFFAIMQDMLQALIADGVTLRTPAHAFGRDGSCQIAQYVDSNGELTTIEEVKAHPLLKPLMDLISRNNLSLGDLNMTPKIQVDQGIQSGHLQQEQDDRQSAQEYRAQTQQQLGELRSLINRSQARASRDPVLIEHIQTDTTDGAEAEVIDGDSP